MPVGKESIKRAAGARKKSTAKAAETKAAEVKAAETGAAENAPAKETAAAAPKTKAKTSTRKKPVVAAETVITNASLPTAADEKNRIYGIKDELPIYLL